MSLFPGLKTTYFRICTVIPGVLIVAKRRDEDRDTLIDTTDMAGSVVVLMCTRSWRSILSQHRLFVQAHGSETALFSERSSSCMIYKVTQLLALIVSAIIGEDA
jgi:hypothetical protein